MSTSKGGSAQTYHGFISYVQAMPPLFVFYENVDAIEDAIGPQAVSNMDILLNQMSELGYASQKMMTDAKEFRLPARRRRSYVLFVRQTNPYLDFSKQGLHDALATFRLMVASCLRSAPCVSEVLLDNADDDEAAEIAGELEERRARVAASQGAVVEQEIPTPRSTKAALATWWEQCACLTRTVSLLQLSSRSVTNSGTLPGAPLS